MLKMELKKLFKQRKSFKAKQKLYSQGKRQVASNLFRLIICAGLKYANDPAVNIYDIKINSIKDAGFFGRQPDIYIFHITTALLSEPNPHNKDQVEHYKLCYKRKVYHQCGATIVELKQGPSQ